MSGCRIYAIATFISERPVCAPRFLGVASKGSAEVLRKHNPFRTLRCEAVDSADLVAMPIVIETRRGWQTDAYIGHHHRTMEHRRTARILRCSSWVAPAPVIEVDT